jgi:hypothetical protein
VQVISLNQHDRPRPDIAKKWLQHLTAAVRKRDKRHLITVGLVDWSLDRKGLTSGFVPEKIVDEVDFISVHIYPQKGKVDEALQTLAAFSVGRPVVIEETFPLKCSITELEEFLDGSKKHAAGWIGFYWGKPPEELRKSKEFGDVVTLAWLELFEKKAKEHRERSDKIKACCVGADKGNQFPRARKARRLVRRSRASFASWVCQTSA